ncbi:MAG: hypothetical protein WBW81_04550 [Methylocella sp.]
MKEFSDADRLYLDDLQIGQRFTSGTHVVDEERIKAFARQFDPQPFHLDNEVARGTLFSGLAASGWRCDHQRRPLANWSWTKSRLQRWLGSARVGGGARTPSPQRKPRLPATRSSCVHLELEGRILEANDAFLRWDTTASISHQVDYAGRS